MATHDAESYRAPKGGFSARAMEEERDAHAFPTGRALLGANGSSFPVYEQRKVDELTMAAWMRGVRAGSGTVMKGVAEWMVEQMEICDECTDSAHTRVVRRVLEDLGQRMHDAKVGIDMGLNQSEV